MIIGARIILRIREVDRHLCLSYQGQVAEWRQIARRYHLLDHFIENDDFDANSLVFFFSSLRLIRVLTSVWIYLPLDCNTDRILTILLILFILLYLEGIAALHQHLFGLESLLLAA